jgi:acetyl/propionyl-CoA carboxylase alpha subunit
MLAKVIAHAPTRSEAAARLASVLRRSRIHGVTTNRDLLTRILEEPEFLAGSTDTAYLDRHDVAALAGSLLDRGGHAAHVVAAAIGWQAAHRRDATVVAGLPSGWRNNPSQPQRVQLINGSATVSIEYRFDRSGRIAASMDGEAVDVELHPGDDPGTVTLSIDGVRRSYRVDITASVVDVSSALGSSSYQVVDRLPDASDAVTAGSLVAPMPGAVVRVLVGVGDSVVAQQPLVVLEAMKMEHTVASPAAGSVVELKVAAGQQVDAGMVLAVVAAEDTDRVAPAAP